LIELFLVIFLQSGIIKVLLTYFNIPTFVDLTVLSALLLLIIILINLHKNKYKIELNKNQISSIFIMFLILISIIFSLFYTSSENYAYTKTLHFFTILIAFIYPIILKEFSIKKFFTFFILSTLVISIIYTPLFLKSYAILYTIKVNAKAEMIYGSYLTIGYIIGISIILNVFSNLFNNKIKLILTITLFGILFITGARGPIVFLLLTFILYGSYIILIKRKINLKKIILSSSIVLLILIPLSSKINLDQIFERSINRLFALTTNSDSAANDRITRYLFVLEKTDSNNLLLGHGFGSFGIEYEKKDLRSYPHNIFLEFLFELGIIGLFLFLFLLYLVSSRLFYNKKFLLFAIFIFLLLNSMKSLSISDSRIMFSFFAIIIICNSKLLNFNLIKEKT
jgi:O-antigen ligase